MTKEFDKRRLLNNISYLIKEQKIKTGEFEKAVGVSPGYISRSIKDELSKPGIDFVVNAANYLNVSIDTLFDVDLWSLTSTERYLVSFIEKLSKDTNEDKLFWEKETIQDLQIDPYCVDIHPLFVRSNNRNDGYYSDNSVCTFVSDSFRYDTSIGGDCFHLELSENNTCYVMNILDGDAFYDEEHALELWLHDENGKNTFLCSDKNSSFTKSIRHLYQNIVENNKHIKVDKEVKSIIDGFMNN